MRGGLLAALLCVASANLFSSSAAAAAKGGADQSSALVVFFAPPPQHGSHSEDDAIQHELSSIPTLSTGILSATQGSYNADQLLLDITQGARVSGSAYSARRPPPLSSLVLGPPPSARISSWPTALERANSAPQLLDPGLLAASIPGGGAYAAAYESRGSTGAAVEVMSRRIVSMPLVADRSGKIAAVSFGRPSTLIARISTLRAAHRLVVADLPSGASGYAELRTLAGSRPSKELLVVLQSPLNGPGHELLWSAVAGPGHGGQTLTSQTTNQRGLIVSIDIAPTILHYLGLPIPPDMRGKPVSLDGPVNGAWLRALKARLEVVSSRRLPALAWLVAGWALLLATMRLPVGRHGRDRRSAWAIRVGALALLWAPAAVLLPAALEPSRTAEFVLIVATCFALGALTDLLVRWPRAPIVPAVAAVVVLSVDALAGTQLLVRSLLGPDPILGARFYGIGNELKSGLAVLVFSAVAAALYPAVRSRRAAAAMACAGILLAIVEGSARIGAGVGGVILVSAGTAVATVMVLPGGLNRKRILLAMAAPVVGLVALAAIDLTTAHGGGHFTGSVLDARSAGDVRDIIVRRYGAAWDELKNHLMPFATALAVLASAVAVGRGEQLCAPVDSDPAWLAALAGGLTAGVIGALTEDSGPVLLVVAVYMLGCVLSYVWGRPPEAAKLRSRNPGTPHAVRSHALRRSAAPSR